MHHALEKIVVLDLSDGMAGGLAAAMCADFGATVIKIEKPGVGNSCRKTGPFIDGISLTDCRINRGKHSVELDLHSDDGRNILRRLAATADVIFEDFNPGTLPGLGLGYKDMAAVRGDIIYCSVTPFGQTGPYAGKKGNELVVQALSGVLGTTGEVDRTPQQHGFPMGEYAAAYSAYSAVVTALCYRHVSGNGQYIDVSGVRALLYMNSAVERITLDIFAGLEGNHHPTIAPFGIFTGKNGQSIVICALNVKLWNALCELMGQPELMNDPRFVTVGQRAKNRLEVAAVIEKWLSGYDDITEVLGLLQKASVPASLIYSTDDVLHDEHIKASGWLCEVPMPQGSQRASYVSQGPGFVLSETPGAAHAAPVLGSSTERVLASLGLPAAVGATCSGTKKAGVS